MIKFRPFAGLTLMTLIALAILLTLGTWQYNRLKWKTQLLADVEIASQSAPFTSYGAINRTKDAGAPIDFRRVSLSGSYISSADTSSIEFHVFKTHAKSIAWRVFRPLRTEGGAVFVAAENITDSEKAAPRSLTREPLYVSGYVRAYQKPSRFAAKSTPELNRWFSFNASPDSADWGQARALEGQDVQTDYYIDAVTISQTPIEASLPIKKPDLPNNHFDYMLTWYSFALILFVIYLILHLRAGRLSLRA